MGRAAGDQDVSHHQMTLAAHLVLLAAVALATSGRASAQMPPPGWGDDVPGEATLFKQPVAGAFLGHTYLEFGRSTLQDVVRSAGVGSIERQGDGGSGIRYVCLTDDIGETKTRLWFVSSVVGGPDMAITELNSVALGPGDKANNACPRLPSSLRPARLDRSVWIGTSERSLNAILGAPSIRHEGWTWFTFIGQCPESNHGKVVNRDVMSILSVKVHEGRVTALRANKVTTH